MTAVLGKLKHNLVDVPAKHRNCGEPWSWISGGVRDVWILNPGGPVWFKWCHIHLRTYPYRFGLRILRVLPELMRTGCKTIPPCPNDFNPLALYQSLEFSDWWQDAGMIEVLQYLRGNCNLSIPPEWRDHLLPNSG